MPTNTTKTLPTRASHCSCGRPAVEVFHTERFGDVGYCGAPAEPLDPCDCGQGFEHDRSVCHAYGNRDAADAVPAAPATFTLAILHMDGAAFDDAPAVEVAEILRGVADQVEAGQTDVGAVLDATGRTVGAWNYARAEVQA